jgi:hypothetical protein
MIQAILGIFPGLLKLGSELIEDPDKKNEYAFKALEMTNDLALRLLDTKTYPWVDALVKLAYAGEAIFKGLFRPLASTAAMGFVAYCSMHGIELDPVVQGVMASLLPAWGISRYKEKMSKKDESDIGW